jgi:SAM-dependent methyltransferase
VQLEARRRRKADPATFSDADVELEETLDSLDGADNYARWIFSLLEPFLGEDVLEIGAGHGTFTALVAERVPRVVATDLSPRCVGVLKSRFADAPNVEVALGDVSASSVHGPFDCAILINVLEHIEDDDRALQQLWASLNPGGRLILWVPAFQALYTEFDRRVGHFRRYRTRDLTPKLCGAGFEVAQIKYVNAVGAMAWWLVARVLRLTPTRPSSVAFYDRYVVPVVRRIESKFRPPFGQSIFAVGVRPATRGPEFGRIMDSGPS